MNKIIITLLSCLSALTVAATTLAEPGPGVSLGHRHLRHVCNKKNLSKDIQRRCDRKRFAGEPHYIVVRVAPNGGIRSYHLRRTETGEEVLTAYPYGRSRALTSGDPRETEVRMTYDKLEPFWRGRPVPDVTTKKRHPRKKVRKQPVSGAGSDFFAASGLELGWNPSTGPSTTECIEVTIAPPDEVAVMTAFSSQGQASSTSEQINVSATVKEGFSSFNASDTFSYSDSYKASANSGFQYWNLANIYSLNTAATGAFTNQGQAALDSGTFSTTCGSQYMTSVQGGFYATISMSWNSSSSSTSSTISDTFSVSYELDSLSTAASVSQGSSNSEDSFTLSIISYGGGLAADGGKTPSQILTDAFAAADANNNPYYVLCAGTLNDPPAPDSAACDQFSGAMSEAAVNASNAFTDWVNSLGAGSNMSAFELFPSGVAGIANPGIVTEPMPTPTSTNDALSGLQTQLEQYTDVLNQLATLQNRARYLASAVAQNSYDPANTALQLSLAGLLNFLENSYDNARATVLSNLQRCLAASSDNVSTVCQAVTESSSSGIKTAYDWFKANNPQQLLLQNTIALQYSGIFTNSNNYQWPQDIVYYNPLPSWSNLNDFVLIGGQAALVGFADAAYINNNVTQQTASVTFLPLHPSADLANVLTQVYTTQGTSPPGLWFGWLNNMASPGTNDASQPLSWLGSSAFCMPTAVFPCELWFGISNPTAPEYPLSLRMDAIPGLFPTTGN